MHPDQGNTTNYNATNPSGRYPPQQHHQSYPSPLSHHHQLSGITSTPMNSIPSFVHPVDQVHHQPNGSNLRSTQTSMSNAQGNAASVIDGYGGVPDQSGVDGVLNMF